MILKTCAAAALTMTASLPTTSAAPVETVSDAAIRPGHALCLGNYNSGCAESNIVLGADWNKGEGRNYVYSQLAAATGWVGDWGCTDKGSAAHLGLLTDSGYAKLLDPGLRQISTQIPAGFGAEDWTELACTTEAGDAAPSISPALSGIYLMVSDGIGCVNPMGTVQRWAEGTDTAQ